MCSGPGRAAIAGWSPFGHAATVAAGEWITASGERVNDRTHGQRFKARFIRSGARSSDEGIEKYLAQQSLSVRISLTKAKAIRRLSIVPIPYGIRLLPQEHHRVRHRWTGKLVVELVLC